MPTFLELNLFTLLLVLAVGLLVWFLIAREISSTRRMTCMMAELGLDYDLAAASDPATEAIITQARARCLRCRAEGLCERWLDAARRGEALANVTAGATGNVSAADFCPNAAVFGGLAKKGALQVEPPAAGGQVNAH